MNNTNQQRATACFETLQQWYSNGQWQGAGFWNNAISLQAVLDYSKWSGWTGVKDICSASLTYYRQQTQYGFGFFDDVQWWAISFIEAYQQTGEAQYLQQAESIFAAVASEAWSDICGGGVRWQNTSGPPYKNAITNELFLMLSTSLHLVTGKTEYADWANREWQWFKQTGMINSQSLINDGLTKPDTPHPCINNGETTWTYNQGVILGGLVNLSHINADPSLIAIANNIATATITQLVHNGILQEPCEPTNSCHGNNPPQFKGIFIRYLRLLMEVSNKPEYTSFLQLNANSAWNKDRQTANNYEYFGMVWYGPFDHPGAIRQTSALDLFNAAATLSCKP